MIFRLNPPELFSVAVVIKHSLGHTESKHISRLMTFGSFLGFQGIALSKNKNCIKV